MDCVAFLEAPCYANQELLEEIRDAKRFLWLRDYEIVWFVLGLYGNPRTGYVPLLRILPTAGRAWMPSTETTRSAS